MIIITITPATSVTVTTQLSKCRRGKELQMQADKQKILSETKLLLLVVLPLQAIETVNVSLPLMV